MAITHKKSIHTAQLKKANTKKKLTYKRKLKGGASQEEINNFIEETLTTERTVKDRSIKPVPWVWELLSKNDFFNNTYVPALASMKDYKKKNTIHREFSELQNTNPNFYLMDDPNDKTQKSLISTKKESFYDKTPAQLYEWWLTKQKYMDEKNFENIGNYPLNDTESATETIISVITPCIINCITHILNSYIKYGEKEHSDIADEHKHIENILSCIEAVYAENATYETLSLFILWFAAWYYIRVPEVAIENNEAAITNRIIDSLNQSKLFYLPMSTGLTINKAVNMYAIPVLYFSMVNEIGHGTLFQPYANIAHDMIHYKTLINIFIKKPVTVGLTSDNLKLVYTLAKDFYMLVDEFYKTEIASGDNERKEFVTDLCYILFSYLHEFAIIDKYDINKEPVFYLPNEFHVKIIENITALVNDTDLEKLKEQYDFMYIYYKIKTVDGQQLITGNRAHEHYMSVDKFNKINKKIKEFIDMIYKTEDDKKNAKLITTNKDFYFNNIA